MHDAHHRPPPQSRRQEPRQPPALPAPRARPWCSGRCARQLQRARRSRTLEQGRRDLDPDRRRARADAAPRPRRAASATTCCPATRSIIEGDTHPAARAAAAAAAARRAARWRRRGRFPLRAVARGIPRPLPRGSRAARPRQAAAGDASKAEQWRRAGYTVAARRPICALTRTMRNSLSRRIALKRPQARGNRGDLGDEIASSSAKAVDDEVQLALAARRTGARSTARRKRIPYIDPDRPALPPLRTLCRSRSRRR